MEYDLNTYIWRWPAVCYEYLVYHIPAPKTSPYVKGINLVQIKGISWYCEFWADERNTPKGIRGEDRNSPIH